MNIDRALERLDTHQRLILGILADARRSLLVNEAAQRQAIALERWKLVRALREYQLFKHVEIFDPVIERAAPPRRDVAGLLKSRCLAVGADYEEHVRRWSLDSPGESWTDYRREACAIADRIERHLHAEMHEVRALLSGTSHTRQA